MPMTEPLVGYHVSWPFPNPDSAGAVLEIIPETERLSPLLLLPSGTAVTVVLVVVDAYVYSVAVLVVLLALDGAPLGMLSW